MRYDKTAKGLAIDLGFKAGHVAEKVIEKVLRDIERETLERAAKVAEGPLFNSFSGRKLAGKIRALGSIQDNQVREGGAASPNSKDSPGVELPPRQADDRTEGVSLGRETVTGDLTGTEQTRPSVSSKDRNTRSYTLEGDRRICCACNQDVGTYAQFLEHSCSQAQTARSVPYDDGLRERLKDPEYAYLLVQELRKQQAPADSELVRLADENQMLREDLQDADTKIAELRKALRSRPERQKDE